MAFIYCQSCGTKHNYSTSVPNFCNKCGSALSASSQALQENEQPQTASAKECGANSASWKNISKLSVDVQTFHEQPLVFGDIVSKGSLPPAQKRRGYQVKGNSAAKDILKSCQSSKPQDIDDPTAQR